MNKSLVLIAHRGNTEGRNIAKENSPLYIDDAISKGFDVEIDLRLVNEQLFLGHDLPQYKIEFNWLNQRKAIFGFIVHLKQLIFYQKSIIN